LIPPGHEGKWILEGSRAFPNVTGGVGMADILLTPIPATVPNAVNSVGGPGSVFASNISGIDDIRQHADSRIMPNPFQRHRLEGIELCSDSA